MNDAASADSRIGGDEEPGCRPYRSRPQPEQVVPDAAKRLAADIEPLQLVVVRVGHQQLALRGNGDPRGVVECALAETAGTADHALQGAVIAPSLHAVVVEIRHIECAGLIKRETGRRVELSGG